MGLRLSNGERTWSLDDGKSDPALPARLEEGSTVAMAWMREELGEAHYKGEAQIKACFAVDSRGKEVVRHTRLL